MEFEQEMETYRAELPKLVANKEEGKFIVISGNAVLGIYGTYEDALRLGYEKRQLKPFMVKRIEAVEQAQYFSRDLNIPCPT